MSLYCRHLISSDVKLLPYSGSWIDWEVPILIEHKRHPTCFISYCSQGIDRSTIDLLVDEFKRIAPPQFKILIDTEQVDFGESITKHEDQLEVCDIAVILLTPEYKNKVSDKKPSGTFREYSRFVSRFQQYREKIKTPDDSSPSRPFYFIPILVSGNHLTAIPKDIQDYRAYDFTKFRAQISKDGKSFLTNTTKQSYKDNFKKIEGIFSSCLSHRKKTFHDMYSNWQKILFIDTKHENTTRLLEEYHVGNSEDLIDSIFVKTNAYNRISTQEKCILIGRKGSGKSTIVGNFHEIRHREYKPPISVHVDAFRLSYVYEFLGQTHAGEVGDVVSYVDYFHVVWLLFSTLSV